MSARAATLADLVATSRAVRATRARTAKVAALRRIAAERGQTLPALALAWTLRDPRMTSTLVGASSVAQLEANLRTLERLDLSDDELAEIDGFETWSQICLDYLFPPT